MADEMGNDEHAPATRGELRSGLDSLRSEMNVRFESVESNLHRLNVGFARMQGDMTEMKGKVDILLGLKEDFSRHVANAERMTGYFESCVRKMDSQGAMLMEHEARLTKRESRSQ